MSCFHIFAMPGPMSYVVREEINKEGKGPSDRPPLKGPYSLFISCWPTLPKPHDTNTNYSSASNYFIRCCVNIG